MSFFKKNAVLGLGLGLVSTLTVQNPKISFFKKDDPDPKPAFY